MDIVGDEYAKRVIEEANPILREIWAQGYTHIEDGLFGRKITLINKHTKYTKEIDLDEFHSVVSTLSFKRGLMPDGTTHTWVAEADGSADRLRALIEESND